MSESIDRVSVGVVSCLPLMVRDKPPVPLDHGLYVFLPHGAAVSKLRCFMFCCVTSSQHVTFLQSEYTSFNFINKHEKS